MPTLANRCRQVASFFGDPRPLVRRVQALPYFARNLIDYRRKNTHANFRVRLADLYYCTNDRFDSAGVCRGHYFHQDIWAAQAVKRFGAETHVDVASRIDGFVAHLLVFCRVIYVDLRPLTSRIENLEFRQGSLAELPFETDSVRSLSCLHVIEHIGLGRYGDPIDPDGYLTAARELVRVLEPGGMLLIGTPVGRERLCYDAHRVFDPQTIVDAFAGLDLVEFALIDDQADAITAPADFETARRCDYGCGLFRFTKPVC
jgi:SAM-dependent methyltransferase